MGERLRAITLSPEWAHVVAIDHPAAKRTENRTWKPPGTIANGEPLAIHAGKTSSARKPYPAALLVSAAADAAGLPLPTVHAVRDSCIVAVATVLRWDRDMLTPWDIRGRWHWRLAVRVLSEAVPCGGRQGIWFVPDDVAARVIGQMEATDGE